MGTDKNTQDNLQGLRTARLMAVQAIFEHLNRPDQSVEELLTYYVDNRGNDFAGIKPNKIHFKDVLTTAIEHEENIKTIIEKYLSADWNINRVDPLLVAILMAGIAEFILKKSNNRLLISEYIRITEGFFTQKECNFINKVLDKAKEQMV